ncbi:MAG: hypothetical protein IKD50_09310 [Clostridia bacterium]|nr:hypothetical protein [Clostridia bacterium]
MKRFLAIMLAAMFLLCSSLAAYAEDTNSNTNHQPQMGGEAPEGMPPEMPEGGFPGGPGGTPPEKPDGQPGGPGRPGSAPGNAPGRQQSHVEGQLGSWSMGGTNADGIEGDDYAYDAALYVTADGISEEKSATDRITSGSYDAQSVSGIVISDSESGHNGILVYNTDYTISNAEITMLTDADGSDTCDFSGKGTAIAAFGSDANVTITDSTIHTAGVATMPIFADEGATVTVQSSVLQSDGGTLNSDYLNTPTQTLMVAPPWILGIMGNARCSNMMGRDTTTNVIDSETSAGAWAVLSTDAGDDMYLNVYNSSLTLNNADESAAAALQADGGQISETLDNPYTVNYGSGYGTYVIGRAVETFAGSDINVGTYATIFTGGSATYTALEAGQTYELKNHAGETTAVYEASEDKVTIVHSDTFGFMAHQNSNTITLEKGTVVDSGYATFLVKTGHSNQTLTAVIDDSAITNGGVLIQVMDNDDATNGGMMSADDPLNTNGGSQNFKPYHTETVGFNTDQASADGTVQTFTFTNGEYTGNIYNASGSDGLNGNSLNATFGAGAQYSGAIASTSAIHVTYDGSVLVKENGGYAFDDTEAAATFAEQYQNTNFTINEYWSIGQVANLVNDNGANAINITLTDDAVWQVTGTSLVSSLTIQDQAQVIISAGIVLTVDGTEYTDCVLTADSLPAE